MIATDHQRLHGILIYQKQVFQVLSPRIRHWCVELFAYSYKLEYKLGEKRQNVDALRRLFLPNSANDLCPPEGVFMIAMPIGSPLPAAKIARRTEADPRLSGVFYAVQRCALYQFREATLPSFQEKH